MNRIEAIRMAIKEMEKKRRLYSADQVGLRPLKGAEKDHAEVCECIAELKEICRAMQDEGVKRSIAAWQTDVMENGPSAMETDDLT